MKSKRAVLIGLVASLSGLAAAAAPTDRPSPTDPRGWRAVLGSEARQSHVLRPGVELFFTGENERVVAVLRVAGAAANEGVTFTVPGASGFSANYNGHVRLTLPDGDLAFLRPGAVQDDGTGLKPVFVEWKQAGPAGVKMTFPGHDGKLPLLVRFEVIFLADPAARDLYDRNGDGRIDLNELQTPDAPVAPQAEAPEGGPVVSASLVDAFVVDNGTAGQANPGDVIGYTATIASTGTTATALSYNNPIDPDTTLVGGSVNVSPLALNDTYSAVGNVTLDVDTTPAGIFGNDREFPFGPSTFTLATAGPNAGTQSACGSFPCTVTTSGGGTVILKSPGDGRFTYTSPAGVSTGTDTFVYFITDGTLTDSATVTFNIAGRVWFVKADAPGGGNGTQATPFNVLSPATVAGVGGAGDVDGPNDYIYLYETAASTDYAAGIELEPTQHLVGSGVALVVGATTVLPAGAPPTLANASGNGVTLSTDSDVRGLIIAAANNSGISASGSIGTLGTVDSSVSIVTSASGTGATFTNVASPNTLAFAASISGTGSGPAVSVTGQNGALNLATAIISKTSGRLVEVLNKTGGSVSFGGPTLTGGGANAVLVQGNTGGTQVSFASTLNVSTTGSGDAVSIQTNNASGGATTTFSSGMAVSAGNGRALFASNGGTLTIPTAASTLNATGTGGALDVSGTTFGGGGATFATVTSTGNATNGVNLVNVTGAVTMNGGAISGTSGTAFNVAQGSSGITYAGAISKTNAGRVVDVQTRAGGTVLFSGAITATGTSSGINVSGATAVSTVNFTGAVDLGTSGTRLTGGTALTVNHNGNASVTSFSDLDVFTTGQAGIDASNGGTFNVTTGQIDAGGRALNLDGLAAGATFTSVVSTGSASQGVRLNAVTGTLTHTSTSVTGAGTQGISVAGSSANVTFASGANTTTVSGSTTQGILVGTSTGTVAFGNTTVAGGTDGVSFQNNSAGSRTFGTLTVNSPGAVGFLHGAGGGAVTVTGAASIATPTGAGVQIDGNGASAINFNSTLSVNKTNAGTGVLLGTVTTNAGTVNLGTLSVTTTNGTAIVAGSATTTTPLTTSGAGVLSATNGPAINARGTAFAASFGNVSSATGVNGLNLNTCSGTLTMSGAGGTITGSTGTAVAVTNGTLTATYAGNVTQNNAQRVVDVQTTTSGTITLSGTVTGGASSTGVNINGANGNVSFGTLNLGTSGSRMTSQAVTINGGTGTYSLGAVGIFTSAARGINAANADGTLNSSSGTVDASGAAAAAIDIDGPVGLTTLGMTLTRVDVNGATNGIRILDTNGSFTIAGTGAAGSGGTLQNTTSDSIALTRVVGVNLSSMNVQSSSESGILGDTVNGLNMTGCSFTNNGNDSADVGVKVTNLTGSATWTNTSITGSALANVFIDNTVGTLSLFSISGGSYSSLGTAFGGNSILVNIHGTGVLTAGSISGASFLNNKPARAITIQSQENGRVGDAPPGTTNTFTVQNCVFTNNGIQASFEAGPVPGGNHAFRFLNNGTAGTPMTMTLPAAGTSHALNAASSSQTTTGSLRGRLEGNFVGSAGVPSSGSPIGNALRVFVQGKTAGTLLVDSMFARQIPQARGIDAQFLGPTDASGGPTSDITVTGNNVDPQDSTGFPAAAIYVAADSQGGGAVTARSDVRGNTVPSFTGGPCGGACDVFPAFLIVDEVVAAAAAQHVDTAPGSGTCTQQLTEAHTNPTHDNLGTAAAAAGCALIAGPIGTPP